VACRPVARQRPRRKQRYNSRYSVTASQTSELVFIILLQNAVFQNYSINRITQRDISELLSINTITKLKCFQNYCLNTIIRWDVSKVVFISMTALRGVSEFLFVNTITKRVSELLFITRLKYVSEFCNTITKRVSELL
jgi:hypothetical protein